MEIHVWEVHLIPLHAIWKQISSLSECLLRWWNIPHSRLLRLRTYPQSSCEKNHKAVYAISSTVPFYSLKTWSFTLFATITTICVWLFQLTPLPAASPQVGFSDPGPFSQKLCHAAQAIKQDRQTLGMNEGLTRARLKCLALRQPDRTFWSMSGKCSSMTPNDFPFMAKWYCDCDLCSPTSHMSSRLMFTSCQEIQVGWVNVFYHMTRWQAFRDAPVTYTQTGLWKPAQILPLIGWGSLLCLTVL